MNKTKSVNDRLERKVELLQNVVRQMLYRGWQIWGDDKGTKFTEAIKTIDSYFKSLARKKAKKSGEEGKV